MRKRSFIHGKSLLLLSSILLLISFARPALAQERVRSFPSESAAYLNTLQQHFQFVQKSKKKDAINFMQFFKAKWQSDFFSESIKSEIYKTSNKMIASNMAAIPYFRDYFTALIDLIQNTQDDASIKAWMDAVQHFIDQKEFRKLTPFVRSSGALFKKGIVFYDRSLKWKINTTNYRIQFLNDTLKYIFPETDLLCLTKGDSTKIYKTAGVYFPLSNTWEGEKGKLGWTRAGYSIDSVYAELKNYKINLLYSKFSADSVLFYQLNYFKKPLLGKLQENVLASLTGNRAIFPKFISYSTRWKIPNIFPNMNFTGGIRVEGKQLHGFGDESAPASIVIMRNDTAFIKLRSKDFSIQPSQISSLYTSFSIHHQNDSIYHSGLHMHFTKENQLLSFIRDDHGLTANPFYNTFHQIDMYVEAVYWKMDENKISFDMSMGRTKRPARFESTDYFSEARFNQLQGMDVDNPLVKLKEYADKNRSNIVYFDEYADYLHMPIEQIQLLLLKLAHQGFLLYDDTNGRAVLGDKINFYLKAYAGDIDSDVIRFESKPKKNEANAYLQIDNFDLRINGLDRIILSDSQNLIIEPTNKSIVLGKNKNFSFDGKITAGRLSFATSHSSFNYNEFKLDMPTIDSLWFWVNGDMLPGGGRERKYVKTAIRNLSGDLLIDHPNNKSGLKPMNEYPIFNSKKDSYVYYNTKNIQNGVYTKDRFYFHVNPFILSSLNNFSTDDIAFEGYLSSAGIFPDISQALTVQDDYSLGFTKELPPEGIMAYGNKGRFYNEINLSNRGLKGNGKLTFINSLTTADDFVFLPDSMNVYAQTFELKPALEPVEFPKVDGKNTYQQWLPYQEKMQISSINENIKMYDDETSMEGSLILRPTSLSGKGNIHYKVAKLSSNNYIFKNQVFDARRTNFTDVGMKLNNFSAHTDYNTRDIVFSSNDGTSKVDFPENAYICYMNEARWYMDKDVTEYASNFHEDQNKFKDFSLRQLADIEYKGSDFISTHPGQDSLTFVSTRAQFNSKDKIIQAEGVHYVKVADAVVFPKDNELTILKNANITPLEDASIITNAVTKYHEINKANVKIKGRKSYAGSGDYIYIDKNGIRQPIHFKDIQVNAAYQTVARGEIFAKDNFALSPEFYFRGMAILESSRKLLQFDGGFRISSDCTPGQNWIKFNSVIDPVDIMIPIARQPIVPDASKLQKFVGVLNSPARNKTYGAFLSNRIDYYDSLLFSASGYIRFDEANNQYQISSKEKLNQMVRPDNYFSLRLNNCSTYGEGKINLDVRYIDLKLESYGNIHNSDSISDLKLGAALDFHFSNDALKLIADQFSATTTLKQVDNNSPFYAKMLGGFMGMEPANKYLSRLLLGNQRRVPEQLLHTLFLSEINLKWSPKLHAYVNTGMIGFGNLDKYKVNAYTKGRIEFKKSRLGDELSLYFEINNQWYFFKYANNVMQVLSSNPDFNTIIQSAMDAKGEKNRLKADKRSGKRSTYRYVLSKEEEKDNFLKQLNSI
jgi:hypothetical protein